MADPPHASAAASHSPPTPGHAPPRFLARCSATRIRGPCKRAAWPDELVLPSARPTALLGFRSRCPSQVCSRRRVVRHVSVRPGPRAVLAVSSAPIFFVGVTGCSPGHGEAHRPGMRWRRLPGFVPACGPPRRLRRRVRSCLGLVLLQGWRAQLRASGRARPRPDHQPPGMSRRSTAVRVPLSARGLAAPFPSRHARPAVRREPPGVRGP